jgi:hypothetical protein
MGDERAHVVRMRCDQREGVDCATAAREEIDGTEPRRLDDRVEILGMLLGRRVGARIVLDAALGASWVVGDDRAVGEVAGERSEAGGAHR